MGYYCDSSALTEFTICPVGRWCPQGTASPDNNQCPYGQFNDREGRDDSSDCQDCYMGKYCSETGASEVTGDCDAGYYCIGAATESSPSTSTQGEECIAGYFCPTGTNQMIPCTPGYYCDDDGLGEVAGSCEAGYTCYGMAISSRPTDEITGDKCFAGHYCVVDDWEEGDPGPTYHTPCEPGTSSASTGATSVDTCVSCPGGFYCATKAGTDKTEVCYQDYYCPEG
mmetsp:Transcript_3205/g.1897  ORF Transcript_3205/g.1897 Transcript_3205/m.1897 type:complete len:226 (-) Transcript_3205:1458-2135(-)